MISLNDDERKGWSPESSLCEVCRFPVIEREWSAFRGAEGSGCRANVVRYYDGDINYVEFAHPLCADIENKSLTSRGYKPKWEEWV